MKIEAALMSVAGANLMLRSTSYERPTLGGTCNVFRSYCRRGSGAGVEGADFAIAGPLYR